MLTYADVWWQEHEMLEAAREELRKEQALSVAAGTQFTCFTGTKVQILTRIAAERKRGEVRECDTQTYADMC